MTAGLTRRPSRPRRRCLSRSLLGAALVLAGVLAPLEPAALPDPPVQAQTGDAVIPGTPDQCQAPWQEQDINGPVCVLEDTACPADPVGSGSLLPAIHLPLLMDENGRSLGTYAGFCEARHFSQSDQDAYDTCAARTRTEGFIVLTYVMERLTDDEDNPVVHRLCRVVRPPNCPVGSHLEPYTCRAVRRRTWSCPEGYVPRNEYNTCYKPLSLPADPHPACVGIPELVAVRCADYAGNDYTLTPHDAGWACNSDSPDDRFWTGSLDTALDSSANAYWCQFDPADLRVACLSSRPPAGCAPATTAFCLKRASGTGGCNAIANTIRCRIMQAEFDDLTGRAQKAQKAEETRAEGCQPCVILPFESVPTDCPADLTNDPDPVASHLRTLVTVHDVKTSFVEGPAGCNLAKVREEIAKDPDNRDICPRYCANPPAGHIVWSSGHSSGFAVVNSPVVLTVDDIASHVVEITAYSESRGIFRDYRTHKIGVQYRYLGTSGDPTSIVRRWPIPDGTKTHSGISELDREVRGECLYREQPLFKVIVEELWPDTAAHRQEIKELFGDDSLEWWKDLSRREKIKRTEARGLKYLPRLNQRSKIEAEEQDRARDLVTETECNFGSEVWCRWTPTRSGYYKLTAAGAWRTRKSARSPRPSLWSTSRDIWRARDPVLLALKDPDTRAEISDLLAATGLEPADVGLNSTLDDYAPVDPDDAHELAYRSPYARCPPLDLRYTCGGGSSYNYTTSEPIGIMVHEVRVATRTPNS